MSLRSRLAALRRRFWVIGSTSALAWGLAGLIVLLLAAVWLDLLWDLSAQARIGTLVAAAVAVLATLALLIARVARSSHDRAMARRLDQAGDCGGEIVTGLDLDAPAVESASHHAELSTGLARMAVDRAGTVAAGVPLAAAAPTRPLRRAATTLAVLLAIVALLAVCLPGLARTELNRFARPTDDVPPFSNTQFRVEPGDVKVVYGDALEIHAEVTGSAVDQVELVLQHDGRPVEVLPMFPETDGRWRTALAKVTAPAAYHVRAYGARSNKYRIELITVPRIEEVRVEVTQPPYAREPVYAGPVPKQGVSGLPGTKVRVSAKSNRPLSGGTIELSMQADPSSADGTPASGTFECTMQPTADGSQEVVGQFEITADGKFELRVTDAAGQTSQESISGGITLLADQRPFVRILSPRQRSLATPEATLPVSLAAEDDYGVARLELFRSLNDSRPLAVELPTADPAPRRVDSQVYLPLAAYGLTPGDVIKLFGRVEDNDPAGAKGSESSVVTVQIISQEEFERMLQIREGIEVLMSKYREARRRMEGLSKEVEGLRKKLDKLPPDGPVAQEMRKELRRTLQRLRKETDALKKLSRHKLPFDIDNNLAPQLESAASMTEKMADELEKLLDEAELNHDALKRQLEKMAKQLATERGQYDQAVTMPMELLETVFPLIADQSRFAILVLRQQDLAERLAALKGHDDEDEPALKTRMRDLEQEQREIREALGMLLDDIEDHVEALPEDEKFNKLRETATKFVDDVRGSGASEAMGEAEAALAEFSGTRGHAKAAEAAEILRKFLKECQGGGMAQCAGDCLIFQPSLGGCLGNTIAQMLAAMGLSPGSGSGFGTGFGTGGGFGAQRGGMHNMGLYGSLPGMGEAYGAAGNQGKGPESDRTPGGQFRTTNPDLPGQLDAAQTTAAGISDAAVPLRYRRRVGQYFQRIAEEAVEP